VKSNAAANKKNILLSKNALLFFKGSPTCTRMVPSGNATGAPSDSISPYLAADQLGHIIMFFEPNGVGLKLTAGN